MTCFWWSSADNWSLHLCVPIDIQESNFTAASSILYPAYRGHHPRAFQGCYCFIQAFFFCNAVVKDLSPESPWEGETEQIACESSNLTFPPFELLDYFLYSFVFCRSATLITPGILLEMKNLGIKTSDGYFIGTLTYLHWGVSDVLSSLTLGPCWVQAIVQNL